VSGWRFGVMAKVTLEWHPYDMSPAELSIYACFCVLLITSGSERFKQRPHASR